MKCTPTALLKEKKHRNMISTQNKNVTMNRRFTANQCDFCCISLVCVVTSTEPLMAQRTPGVRCNPVKKPRIMVKEGGWTKCKAFRYLKLKCNIWRSVRRVRVHLLSDRFIVQSLFLYWFFVLFEPSKMYCIIAQVTKRKSEHIFYIETSARYTDLKTFGQNIRNLSYELKRQYYRYNEL